MQYMQATWAMMFLLTMSLHAFVIGNDSNSDLDIVTTTARSYRYQQTEKPENNNTVIDEDETKTTYVLVLSIPQHRKTRH
jgi:hypothetical protein